MSKRSTRQDEHPVGQLLAQVCRITGHRLRVHMERIGLHRGQGFALFHLWHHDGVAQHEISEAMHIRPASVTNMLKRMERDGWIERRRDAMDHRVVRVFITKKAKALRKEARDTFQQMEQEISEIYTPEEKATLQQLLLKLHDRFAPEAPGHLHHKAFFHAKGEDS